MHSRPAVLEPVEYRRSSSYNFPELFPSQHFPPHFTSIQLTSIDSKINGVNRQYSHHNCAFLPEFPLFHEMCHDLLRPPQHHQTSPNHKRPNNHERFPSAIFRLRSICYDAYYRLHYQPGNWTCDPDKGCARLREPQGEEVGCAV